MRTAYRTCPLCEATCGLAITLDGDRVTQVRGDADDVFSHGFLCPKGVSIKQLHEDPDRLRTPLVKQPDGSFAEASWDEAFALIAERLPAIQAEHGKDAVAAYVGNPNAHSLAGMIYGRALLKGLGTKNLFSASTVDQYPKQAASAYMFGSGAAVPVPDLDRTDFLLMLGANPAASNGSLMTAPDVRGRLQAIRDRGGKVVVVDPKRTRTAKLADEHLWIRPGTDALLLFALVHVVFGEGLAAQLDPALFEGTELVESLSRPFTPEAVAPATGIPAEEIRRLARELAAAERAAVYGRIGTTTQAFGTTASWLVDVLNAVTGNLDRPGGAMWSLPAHVKRGEGKGRGARFGRWTSRVREAGEVFGELPVACLAEEIETPGEGQVRALITIAGNPVVSTPNADRLRGALDSLDFMVSVDIYVNDTTRHADVILPGPSPLQKAHYDLALYGLAVRNVANWSEPLVPLDMPDEWETLLRLLGVVAGLGPDADVAALDDMVAATAASRAGVEPDPALRGPERIVDAMLRGGAYGLSLADLRAAPHGIDLGPLEPRLPEVLSTPSGKVELAPEPLVADVDRLAGALEERANGGMVLIGRRHLRSNNSWMNHLPLLASGPDRCTAQLSAVDALRLGIEDGAQVRVAARTGAIELPAEVTEDVMPGVVSIPHGWEHANSNVLADERLVEPLTGTAILNGIPVEVSRLGDQVEERGVLVEGGA
ncbi:MAG TPA: molybdopterin-dependent oxidoreductase [Solirubrobacteraceae bacterium]|jgi:anaerobic selenocysteine-containing dehydrogenase